MRSAAGGDGLAVLPTPTGVRALAWSPVRADTLALVGGDGTVRIWHLEDATGHAADPLGGWCRAIAWSPDGRYLAVGDDDGRLQMWDTGGNNDRRRLGGRAGGIRAVAWDPAGDRLVTGHDDGTIRLWQVPGHVEPVSLGRHPETVSDLAWSADGSRVISIGDDGVVRSWTPETDPAIPGPNARSPWTARCTRSIRIQPMGDWRWPAPMASTSWR